MLKRVWANYRKLQPTRLEEYKYEDGSLHYNLVTAFRSYNIPQDEKDKVIKLHKMTDVTAEYKRSGWIS